jgi:hypothetical protein
MPRCSLTAIKAMRAEYEALLHRIPKIAGRLTVATKPKKSRSEKASSALRIRAPAHLHYWPSRATLPEESKI